MYLDLEAIRNAWDEFVTGRTLSPGIDPVVANSWRRCWPRLNPQREITPVRLTEDRILSIQKTNAEWMTFARPIMEDIHQYIETSDTVVLLVNSAGYVLDILGDVSMMEMVKVFGIEVGGLVSEAQMGTFGLALPLLDGVPARTVGAEHYLKTLHSLAVVAAPIFSLAGRPLGALGAISFANHYHPHFLGMVVAGAKAIEGQLQSISLLEEQNNQLSELNTILASLTEGILVWNTDKVLMHVNEAAVEILGLPKTVLVGRSLTENISFPGFLVEAIDQSKLLKDVETNLTLQNRTVNCVVSLTFIQKNQETYWTIMLLKPAEAVHQLVQKQVGLPVAFGIDEFIGNSSEIQQIRRLVQAAAPAKASILIRGESGTGKIMLARATHQESSRKHKPFVLVSCSSLPNEFILSELLGYEQGATESYPGGRPSKFELANGGTIYFQDVEHLPLEAQAILLNAIDLGIVVRLGSVHPTPVDVRVISSTSINLEKWVAEGNFRADLYYRLSFYEINLPPLRARKGDIPLLAHKILERQKKQHNRAIQLASETMNVLKLYPWPGNIRELEAVLARATLQAGESEIIGPMHFPDHVRKPGTGPLSEPFVVHTRALGDVEREAIIQAARQCNGNITKMARALGIGRTTVWRKLRELNITPDQFRT
ncbi:MAG TPA: sigma 54-interacting transcriptional regulator [Anaerolineales bacterium]|nr:sigma 54-interacting transcriptional regulator [Anaerolineales bacterium]